MRAPYFCAQKYALITLLGQKDATGAYVVGSSVGIGLMMYGDNSNKFTLAMPTSGSACER